MSMTAEYSDQVEQEASALVDEFAGHLDLNEDEIAQQIQSQATEFGIPASEAARSVREHLLNKDEVDKDELTEKTSSEPSDDGPADLGDLDRSNIEDWVTVEVKAISIPDYSDSTVAQLGDLADETGSVSFVSFQTSDLPELEEGESYRLAPVTVDTHEGDLQVKLNSETTVTELDEDIDADADAANSGQSERTFTAPVVDIGADSGLIERCPEDDCTRVVSNSDGQCEDHGEVDGEHDLRIKAVLDDGSESVVAYFNAEQTTELTGIDLAEAREIAKEELDMNAVIEEMKPDILGRHISVTGQPFDVYGTPAIKVESYGTDTGDELRADNPEQIISDARSVQASAASDGDDLPDVDEAFPSGPPEVDTDNRQPARRVFAGELNDAGHTFQIGDDDRAPNFALLPTGDIANRVFIVGTLTEVEDVSDDPDDEYLRGRVVGQSGTTFIYAGEYDPDAAAFLRQVKGETPMFAAVTGKVRTYETDEGETNVSVKPEEITEVDRDTREQWVSQTAARTLARINGFDPEGDYFDRLTVDQYDADPTEYAEGVADEMNHLVAE